MKDFREDPNAEPEELWEPEGTSYIDDELVLERSYYNGEEIPPPQRWLTQWVASFLLGLNPDPKKHKNRLPPTFFKRADASFQNSRLVVKQGCE